MGGDSRNPYQHPYRYPYRGRLVTVETAVELLPNGQRMAVECVRHPGGAAVVAVDGAGRVCLLRQYRPVFRDWFWELPAGRLEPNEPPQETARRELAEEGGVQARQWHALGSIVSSPGVFAERIHLFLACDLQPAPEGTASEPHEVFERHWLDYGEALSWARDGRIQDAKTLVGLWRGAAALVQGACGDNPVRAVVASAVTARDVAADLLEKET